MEQVLIICLVALLLFVSAAYVEARAKQRFDIIDVCWGLGFILVAWLVVIRQPTGRSFWLAALVSIWGSRLAWHIYNRHQGRPDDPRYKAITAKWRGDVWRQAYVRIFLLQAILIWLISIPIMILVNSPQPDSTRFIVLGSLIWVFGFVFEALADRQLSNFLKQKKRPRLMQTGLWRYSRHPNYFGELTQWWGIGVIALSVKNGWIGLIGPLILSYLIIFVSGIPPIERKRAGDKDYQIYKQTTSRLIPLPPRR